MVHTCNLSGNEKNKKEDKITRDISSNNNNHEAATKTGTGPVTPLPGHISCNKVVYVMKFNLFVFFGPKCVQK